MDNSIDEICDWAMQLRSELSFSAIKLRVIHASQYYVSNRRYANCSKGPIWQVPNELAFLLSNADSQRASLCHSK